VIRDFLTYSEYDEEKWEDDEWSLYTPQRLQYMQDNALNSNLICKLIYYIIL
jgi:hypothetical protein